MSGLALLLAPLNVVLSTLGNDHVSVAGRGWAKPDDSQSAVDFQSDPTDWPP